MINKIDNKSPYFKARLNISGVTEGLSKTDIANLKEFASRIGNSKDCIAIKLGKTYSYYDECDTFGSVTERSIVAGYSIKGEVGAEDLGRTFRGMGLKEPYTHIREFIDALGRKFNV